MVTTRNGGKTGSVSTSAKPTGVGKKPNGAKKEDRKNLQTPERNEKRSRLESRINAIKADRAMRRAETTKLEVQLAGLTSKNSDPSIPSDQKAAIEEELKKVLVSLNANNEKDLELQEEASTAEQDMMQLDHEEVQAEQNKAAPVERTQSELPDETSFAQTKPEEALPMDLEEVEAHRPSSFDDFTPVPSWDGGQDAGGNLLEGATKILQTQLRGKIMNLVTFGPRNSTMLTWQSCSGSFECDNVTWLHGTPHKSAMDTDDRGSLKYKGKIQDIGAIAWLPVRKIQCMQDLLESVEELNPNNKIGKKYSYPFSTVLVNWKEGTDIGRCWIGRTAYRALTSQKKDEIPRSDRKFYEIACLQVRRYRDYVGGDRLARESVSPTPLPETPEPEYQVSVNDHHQNGQHQNGQHQNGQHQNGQHQNGQHQNGQHQNGEQHVDHVDESGDNNEVKVNLSGFVKKWLGKNNMDPNTPPHSIDDVLFARLQAACTVYRAECRKNNVNVVDDAEIF